MPKQVSCIIPAFNEERRIGRVLQVVMDHPFISEIIVVNDGSTDKTESVVKRFSHVQLVSYEQNKGKSFAVMQGIAVAHHDLILLLDADLEGLTSENVTSLLAPVLKNDADMSVSLRKNAPWVWRALGIDFLSGERVFEKSALFGLDITAGFGLEVFMNKTIVKERKRVRVVPWMNVRSPLKTEKYGTFWSGLRADVRMVWQVFRVASPFTCAYQIWMLRKFRV